MAKTETDAKKAAAKMASKASGTTHLAILVDESFSMNPNQEAVVSGVAEFVDPFQKQAGTIRFWLGYFDDYPGEDKVRIVSDGKKIGKIDKTIASGYRPRGNTPLNDAIAYTIKQMDKRVEKGDKVLVVILTDGLENASEMSTTECKALIAKFEKREEWAFLYLGANQHSETTAASLGLSKQGHAHNFAATRRGTSSALRSAANNASMRHLASDKSEYEALASADYARTGGVIAEDDGDDE